MNISRIWWIITSLLIFSLACNLSNPSSPSPIPFFTPGGPFFPSRTSPPGTHSAPNSTNLPIPTTTVTPRSWPQPYNGSPGPTQITPIPSPVKVIHTPDQINFLLLGSDKRTTSFRTDTIIVLSYQPAHHLVTLISIPRDLFVYIPGWQMQRINTAYQKGGPELLKDTILYNLGVEIDHVALVDFVGFEQIVDTLGGLDVPVYCSYRDWHVIDPNKDIEDEKNWELYTVGPGVVHMDGDLALWYARSRKKSSDFDRGRRQQELLRAIFDRTLSLDILFKVPQLFDQFNQMVATDIQLNDAIALAPNVLDLNAAGIRSYYINTDYVEYWRSPAGASLLLPHHQEIQGLLEEALSPPDINEIDHMRISIEVYNATGYKDWGRLAIERLNYAGYSSFLTTAGETDSNTMLYDYTATQNIADSDRLLSILGLSREQLIFSPNASSNIDYRLVIGADYDPCFSPSKITR